MKLDKHKAWEKVDKFLIKPRIQDYRQKTLMIENIDKLAKILPIKDIFIDMLDISPQDAENMVQDKEQEAHDNLVSALPILNGNLPQNVEVDFGWGTTKEPEPMIPNEGDVDEGKQE